MEEKIEVLCKNCRNPCRLVIGNVLVVAPMGELETHNLWQCDECGFLWRELISKKRIVGNHVIDGR